MPQKPIIHINGSSKSGLQEPLRTAIEKLEEAIDAVQRTFPHARDYYPLGEEAYPRARVEAIERLSTLEGVKSELIEIWESIEYNVPNRTP
jgi:hypothetical protein